MEVSGTVYSLIYEADGDIHIRLTVDSEFNYMLNSYNYSGQYGKLVLEPICATTVTQSDAISSCQGFTNTVYIPNVGERVTATGPFVTDTDHGWNELHPVSKIIIQGSHTSVLTLDTNVLNGFKIYPVPADNEINFEFPFKRNNLTYISIYDAQGRAGGDYQLGETTKLSVTTSYLPNGTYFYNIRQGIGIVGQGQFSVKHFQ
jgi:hypothetical protein